MAIGYTNALEMGWHIFPLHTIENGRCGCGDPECTAIGKHPRSQAWQHTPKMEPQFLSYLEDDEGIFFGNQLLDGYGIVLVPSGLIVVDVDGRNGGFESAERLEAIRSACKYIVQTGSQSGEHWYFKVPKGCDVQTLRTNLDTHPGIDFKSSGYVVGAYSMHASGNRYWADTEPDDITDAPAELIELLTRRMDYTCASSGPVDIAAIAEMVEAIPNTAATSYEDWVEVGMGIHHLTEGSLEGLRLWSAWSRQSNPAESDNTLSSKWRSFGKSQKPVGFKRLYEKATAAGYSQSVEFCDDTDWEPWTDDTEPEPPKHETKANLLRPPGIVGEIVDWINSRCAMPREKLAVAGALQIISNTAGMYHLVRGSRNTSLNLLTFVIAGSRTGKGAVKSCIDEAALSTGISAACHGKFKSSQELIRNALQHQLVAYVYDEFGVTLKKLSGVGSSSSPYLEDLLAEIMAMYSVPCETHLLSGDVKREAAETQDKAIARIAKKMGISDGENTKAIAAAEPYGELANALRMREEAERGIVEPYLTFFGMSEPGSFYSAIEKDPWLLTGGLLGRALLFEEEENVPREKDESQYNSDKMPAQLLSRITRLMTNGHAETGKRVQRGGPWQFVEVSPDGKSFFKSVKEFWFQFARNEQELGSVLESQALGATELAIKVAGILSIETGIITEAEAKWAHELIKAITIDKMDRARSQEALSSHAKEEKGEALLASIMRHIEAMDGKPTTAGRARQAAGRTKVTLADAAKALAHLAKNGQIVEQRVNANGKITLRYCKK